MQSQQCSSWRLFFNEIRSSVCGCLLETKDKAEFFCGRWRMPSGQCVNAWWRDIWLCFFWCSLITQLCVPEVGWGEFAGVPSNLLSGALPVCQWWLLPSLAWQRHVMQGCRQLNGPSRSCGHSNRINNHGNYTTVNLNSKTNLSWVLDMSQSPHWTPTGLALSHQTWDKSPAVYVVLLSSFYTREP